jgi:hypothetical protein
MSYGVPLWVACIDGAWPMLQSAVGKMGWGVLGRWGAFIPLVMSRFECPSSLSATPTRLTQPHMGRRSAGHGLEGGCGEGGTRGALC